MCLSKRPLKIQPRSRQPRKTQPHRARRTRANPQSTDQLRNPYAVKTHERHITWTACVLQLPEPFIHLPCYRWMCVIAGFGSRQPQRGGRVLSQRRPPGAAPARRPVHSLGFSLLLYTPRRKAGLSKTPSVSRASTGSVLCTSATQTETLGDDNRSLLLVINRSSWKLKVHFGSCHTDKTNGLF